jgi:hypothetical protein
VVSCEESTEPSPKNSLNLKFGGIAILKSTFKELQAVSTGP